MIKVTRLAFVVAFFLALSLPLTQMVVGLIKQQPIDENRRLAPPPGWRDLASTTAAGPKFDSWFNDHFGFRSLLIRTKTQIDYSVFSTSNKVQIGQDGWLFYRSVIDQAKPASEQYYRDNGDRIVDNMVRLRDALAAKGISLIVTVNLLADRFVPDDLPATVPNQPQHPAIDRVLLEMADRLGPSYLDMTPVMRRILAERPPFHKTDYHWNEPAAFSAAQAIVRRVAKLTGEPVPPAPFPLDIVHRKWTGGVGKEMPLFVYPQEDALFLRKGHIDIPGFQRSNSDPVYTQRYRKLDNAAGLLPPLTMIGDSFQQNLQVAGIAASFSDTAMARWSFPSIVNYIQVMPENTRVLMLQFMEVSGSVLPLLIDDPGFEAAIRLIGDRQPVGAPLHFSG